MEHVSMQLSLSAKEGGGEHCEDGVAVSDQQDFGNGPIESNQNTERGLWDRDSKTEDSKAVIDFLLHRSFSLSL